MLKNKKLHLIFFGIICIFFINIIISSGVQSLISQDTDQDELVCSGLDEDSYDTPNAFLPYEGNAFLNNFMYDTLAGWNTKFQRYDYCIADSISWAIDGSFVNISINPLAKWSGPGCQNGKVPDQIVSYGTNITAQDVKFSYEYLNNTKWGNINTRIQNITIWDDHHLTMYLHPNSSYSKTVKEWLTTKWPILNQKVWTDISLTLMGNMSVPTVNVFQNRWDNETSCPLKWRVISGPYYLDSVFKYKETGIYNENWWGEGHLYPDILGPGSAKLSDSSDKGWTDFPKKITHVIYGGCELAITGFLQNSIDLGGKGYPEIREYMEDNPNIHVFYDDSDVRSYVDLSSNIELIFNHNRFPLSEVWFRKACAYAIEYAPISTLAGRNNWDRSYPNYLNKANPDHVAVWNQEVEDLYSYDTDQKTAIAYLVNNSCYKRGSTWYAPVPTQSETSADLSELVDEDPQEPGIQVKIGPYEIITPAGWTDTTIATRYWAKGITENLDIEVTSKEVDFGNIWIPSLTNTTFDLAMQCCAKGTGFPSYEVLATIAQPAGPWAGNASAWTGPNATKYYNLVQQLETANDDDYITIAKELQLIFAENLPSIPSHINCFWYQYNNLYWKGFLSSGYYYQQPTTAFSTVETVMKQKLILAVVPANNGWEPPIDPNPMTEWPEGRIYIPSTISSSSWYFLTVFIGVLAIIGYYSKKKQVII